MSVKDKCYVFFNALKFEEYIVYIKVRIWIWWKCSIINLSSNSPKSLLNFCELVKISQFVEYWKFYHN